MESVTEFSFRHGLPQTQFIYRGGCEPLSAPKQNAETQTCETDKLKENYILQKESQLDETLATAATATIARLCNELSATCQLLHGQQGWATALPELVLTGARESACKYLPNEYMNIAYPCGPLYLAGFRFTVRLF